MIDNNSDNNSPKISVIIPVYNAEEYLHQCLESVINQTLTDIEIICVNDGSTDGSRNILEEFMNRDNRVRVIDCENGGAGTARNIGLAQAKGIYLSFLDADDFFEKEMLKEGFDVLEKEKSDIVIFAANLYDERNGTSTFFDKSLHMDYIPLKKPFSPKEMSPYLFNAFNNWTWNKIFRKSFINDNHIVFQSVSRSNDMAYTCEALARAELISIINKAFVNYRIGTGKNLQATNHLAPIAFWDAFVETKKRLLNAQVYEEYQQSYLNWILSGALYNMNANKNEYASMYVSAQLKYKGEEDFGFLEHNKEYYYDPKLYDAYVRLLNYETPKRVSDLREKISKIRKEYQKESEQLRKDHESEISRFESKISGLESKNSRLESKISGLESKNSRLESEISRIRQKFYDQKHMNTAIVNSTSYKIGTAITYIPGIVKRKLRNLMKK